MQYTTGWHGRGYDLASDEQHCFCVLQVGPAPSHDNVLAMQGAQVLFAMRWDTWESSEDSEQEAAVPELSLKKRAAGAIRPHAGPSLACTSHMKSCAAADEDCNDIAKRQRSCAAAAATRGPSLHNRAKAVSSHPQQQLCQATGTCQALYHALSVVRPACEAVDGVLLRPLTQHRDGWAEAYPTQRHQHCMLLFA